MRNPQHIDVCSTLAGIFGSAGGRSNRGLVLRTLNPDKDYDIRLCYSESGEHRLKNKKLFFFAALAE